MKRAILTAVCVVVCLLFAGQGPVSGTGANAEAASLVAVNMAAVDHLGGTLQTITTNGGYAYASEGISFVTFDIANPSAPAIVGRTIMPNAAWDIALDGNYAYVADWHSGMRVIDISDPAAPIEVGSYEAANLTGVVYSVAVSNEYAYLGTAASMTVLDVSDPISPAHVVDYWTSDWVQGVALSGKHAYLANGNQGLTIVDISDPAVPEEESTFNPAGYGYTDGAVIAGDYAYLADGMYGLRVVDVSDPANPVQAGIYPDTGYLHTGSFSDLAVNGSTVYLADENLGLWIIDVSDPAHPTYKSDVAIPNGMLDVAYSNGYALLVQDHLDVYQVSNPAAPVWAGSYASLPDVEIVDAQDNLLLAADRTGDALHAYDITDPTQPRLQGVFEGTNGLEAIQIDGIRAYVVGGGDENLKIFDVSNPTQMHKLGQMPTTGYPARLAAAGSLVFVGDGSNGVVVAEASNAAAPAEIDHYDTNNVNDIAYGDGYVYVADGSGDIIVLNAADPSSLAYTTAYTLTSNRLQVWGNYLITRGTQPASFSIVDVTDPANPSLSSTTFLPVDQVKDIAVVGDLAYILAVKSSGGVRVLVRAYDISSPTSPGMIAEYEIPGWADHFTVEGKYAYVGMGGRGMLVVKLLLPRISTVEPPIGPAGWSTLISVYGDGFADGAQVDIGATPAVSTTYVTETHLQALVPPTLAAGAYDVRVTNPGGSGHTLKGEFTIVDASSDGLFAHERDMFTTPTQPHATEAATLALHVHRVGGEASLNDVTVDFYHGDPDRGGTLIGSGTVAELPPNSVATSSGVPWTPEYAMDHTIYAVFGASGVKLSRVIEVLPSTSDPNPPVVNSVLINGGTDSQDTAGRTVTVQIAASDAGSRVSTMWLVEEMWNGGLGSWEPVQQSGWIPFAETTQWTLVGPPGSRYITVWVADYAGNISGFGGQAHINLLFQNMYVAENELHIFNYGLTTGEQVNAQVSTSGDADLYVGTSATGWLHTSNEWGSASENVVFEVLTADWYTFGVYGYTSARYSLTINQTRQMANITGETKPEPTFNSFPAGPPPAQRGLPVAPSSSPVYTVYLPCVLR